jgi:hypothetical protein
MFFSPLPRVLPGLIINNFIRFLKRMQASHAAHPGICLAKPDSSIRRSAGNAV